MQGKTKTFTLTDAADLPVVVETYTQEVLVMEDPSVSTWPTTDFIVKKPTASNTGIRRPIGSSYTFRRGTAYTPGDIAGYLRLPAGAAATVFQQDEL